MKNKKIWLFKDIFENMSFEQRKKEVEKVLDRKIDYVKEIEFNSSGGYIHYFELNGSDEYIDVVFKETKER